MRITLGHKLTGVVGLLGLVAVGISGFALHQAEGERQQAVATESTWNASLQAKTLAQAIEHAVVQATAIYIATDTDEAKTRLSALQEALTAVEQARGPFLAAMDEQLSTERKRKLDLSVKEFIAYQADTAEMGLTLSPKAALIQATDEATVKNRERMVAEIGALGRETLARLDTRRAAAEEARRWTTQMLLAVPAAALILGLLAAFWIISTQVRRPLHRLRATMLALGTGRLGEMVPFTGRQDEIGEMARAIEGFRTSLIEKQTLDEDAVARSVRDALRADALARATQAFEIETGRDLADLAGSAQAMQGAADTLSATARRTADEAGRATLASVQSVDVVNSIAGAAEELSSSARAIEDQVRYTSDIAGAALSDARGLEATVAGLARAATEIDAVVSLIRSVATQTNLLALNATIEAARAGSAGKGFAVVAAEVKALAGQTASATDRITAQVAAIQAAADGTVEGIGAIGQTIAKMSEAASTVSTAAEQQGQASQEIAHAIANAVVETRTISASIGSVREAAASNEVQAGTVWDGANNVAASADRMRTAIEAFLGRVHAA